MANKKVNKVGISTEELIKLKEANLNMIGVEAIGALLPDDNKFNYQVLTFEGKGLIGINEVLSKFKGEIVQVISFRDEIGKYTLKALCQL
jgi:hypothetical protein